ncbi:TraB/GumN family protein [Roseivivax sp. THAF30]|uniref:TraB/GumN family protein n=1 Tax=Roseivivax sp. THAF30 TaxID=2587852 RepID=UPI0012678CA1|nr:TraB/GumN family protein [Roseivivax sp. THAF30]QFT62175.1 TraB family protein [Roseivivax sp. THAF30]
MRVFFSVLFWLIGSTLAHADCAGTDLRPTLSDAARAEIATRIRDMPNPTGNHWLATRGAQEIRLVGTMHVDDGRFDAVTERLRPLVAASDLLLLELTAEEEAAIVERLASDPSFFVLDGTSLPDLLPEDDWQRIAEAVSARGMPPFMAAKFKPWYVSMILAIPPCMDVTLGGATGLDARLQDVARETGTPTAALEDPITVFEAFEAIPLEEQAETITAGILPPNVAEDIFATLREAYFEERTAESWVLSGVLTAEASDADPSEVRSAITEMEGALLRDRNRAWMPVILGAATPGTSIMVAAGAAHLPGEDGLLALLEAQGFTLERQPF